MPQKQKAQRIFFTKPLASGISDSDPYSAKTLLLGRLIRKFAKNMDEGFPLFSFQTRFIYSCLLKLLREKREPKNPHRRNCNFLPPVKFF